MAHRDDNSGPGCEPSAVFYQHLDKPETRSSNQYHRQRAVTLVVHLKQLSEFLHEGKTCNTHLCPVAIRQAIHLQLLCIAQETENSYNNQLNMGSTKLLSLIPATKKPLMG